MAPLLSKRQKEIYDFVHAFLEENGYAPSLAEIARHFGLSSPATVHEHLKELERKGFIERGWNRKRSLTLTHAPASEGGSVSLPLLGLIAAGQPIEAVLGSETISAPRDMVRPERRTYALRVKGDSMIEDHILDGDYVIVEAAECAENGETVVALIDGSQATLKRYYREGRRIRLQPANESMAPIYVHENDLRIQGVAIGLIRKLG